MKQVWSSATFSPATGGSSGVISSGTTLSAQTDTKSSGQPFHCWFGIYNTISVTILWVFDKVIICTVRCSGERVINDGVKGTRPSRGGHSRESWYQTGKNKELLFSTVVPQSLQPQQEQTDPLAAYLPTGDWD